MSAPPNVAVSSSISSSGGGMGQNGHHHTNSHQMVPHPVNVPHPGTTPIQSPQEIPRLPPSPHMVNNHVPVTGPVHHHPQPSQINHGPSVEVSFPLSREKACRFREIAESDHKLIRDLQKFGIHSIRFQGELHFKFFLGNRNFFLFQKKFGQNCKI